MVRISLQINLNSLNHLIKEKRRIIFQSIEKEKFIQLLNLSDRIIVINNCPSTTAYFCPRNKFCCRLTARNRGTTGEKRSTPIKVSKWKTDSVIGARSKSWIIHFRCMHKHDSFPMRTIAGRKKFFEQKPLR